MVSGVSAVYNLENRLLTLTSGYTGYTYGPANEITSITGASGGWGGESRVYNSVKQLTCLSTSSTCNSSNGVLYNYPTSGNNGKIQLQTDAISGETVTYTYDSLNRLATAENQTGFSPSWGQSFTYDGFGNLTGTSVIKGSAPTMAATYDVNNHAGGEDANGNPGYVPAPAQITRASAVYDVENRMTTVSEGYTLLMNYSYAPGNKRIWRGNGGTTDEVTFYSVSGRKLGCYQITFAQGTTGYYYVAPQFFYTQTGGVNLYFGGKLIKNKNGWVYPDRLGSIGKYYPYGIERPSATTNDTEKFTGYFRDAETGNDYADQRYESPGTGRFLTPDRMSGAPADPGSWNKYAYTQGDPIGRVDPTGTDDCGDNGEEVACVYATGYTLSIEDDEALAVAESLPLSPCYGEGEDISDSCAEWLDETDPGLDIPEGDDWGSVPCSGLTLSAYSGCFGTAMVKPGKKPNDRRPKRKSQTDMRSQGPGYLCNSSVISAMDTVWAESQNGTGAEAAFVLVGTPSSYTVDLIGFTNQGGRVTFVPPAGTFGRSSTFTRIVLSRSLHKTTNRLLTCSTYRSTLNREAVFMATPQTHLTRHNMQSDWTGRSHVHSDLETARHRAAVKVGICDPRPGYHCLTSRRNVDPRFATRCAASDIGRSAAAQYPMFRRVHHCG